MSVREHDQRAAWRRTLEPVVRAAVDLSHSLNSPAEEAPTITDWPQACCSRQQHRVILPRRGEEDEAIRVAGQPRINADAQFVAGFGTGETIRTRNDGFLGTLRYGDPTT